MKRSTALIIAACALGAALVALCAAISVKMTKECEKNKPCKVSFGLKDLFAKKDD